MKLEHIQFFCDVVENGSISQAAKNSFISQQGLSMALKQIENELGIALFHRTNKGVKLTEDGERFYQCCNGMLDLYSEFLQELHNPIESSTFNVYITTTMYKMFSVLNKAPFMKNNKWYFSYTERSSKEVVRMINENNGVALLSMHAASHYSLLDEINDEYRIYNVGKEEKVVYVCHKNNPLLQCSDEERMAILKNMRCVLSSSVHDLKMQMRKMPRVVCIPDLESHKEVLHQQDLYSILNYQAYRMHFNPNEYIIFHERKMKKPIQYYAIFNLKPSQSNLKLEEELVRYLEEMLTCYE